MAILYSKLATTAHLDAVYVYLFVPVPVYIRYLDID